MSASSRQLSLRPSANASTVPLGVTTKAGMRKQWYPASPLAKTVIFRRGSGTPSPGDSDIVQAAFPNRQDAEK